MQQNQVARLFYEDPYRTHARAKVISSQAAGYNRRIVQLDRTLFYPEGGGQPTDRGRIGEYALVDVQKGDGNTILHTLESTPQQSIELQPGQTVQLTLDWEHRFEYMQQHTGQHLLSALLKRIVAANTVSVRQGRDFTTIELDCEDISSAQLAVIVRAANRIVQRNLPVFTEWTSSSQLDQSRLRRPTTITGAVRIVHIQDTDTVACAGVHATTTGELGPIRLCGTDRIRGHVRLAFLIGERAVQEYLFLGDLADSLVQHFSTPVADLQSRILQQDQQLRDMKADLQARIQTDAQKTAAELASGGAPGTVLSSADEFIAVARELGPRVDAPRLLLCPGAGSTRWALAYPGSREQMSAGMNALFPDRWKGGGKAPLYQGVLPGVELTHAEAEAAIVRCGELLD